MTNIIMHGCNGRMGRVISELVEKDSQAKIVAGIDPFSAGSNAYPVYQSINECNVPADVVIDFSNASAVDALVDYCVEKKSQWIYLEI